MYHIEKSDSSRDSAQNIAVLSRGFYPALLLCSHYSADLLRLQKRMVINAHIILVIVAALTISACCAAMSSPYAKIPSSSNEARLFSPLADNEMIPSGSPLKEVKAYQVGEMNVLLLDFVSVETISMSQFSIAAHHQAGFLTCDSAFFFGRDVEGNMTTVKYSLMAMFSEPSEFRISSPLDPTISPISSPLSSVAVLCTPSNGAVATLTDMKLGTDSGSITIANDVPISEAPYQQVCARAPLNVELAGSVDSSAAADAVSAASAAVEGIFPTGFVSQNIGESALFLDGPTSALRLCSHHAAAGDSASLQASVLSFFFKAQAGSIVSEIAAPALSAHISEAAMALSGDVAFAQWDEIDFKCPSRLPNPEAPFSRDYCRIERCTGVRIGTPECYFGSQKTSAGECSFTTEPVVVQRECDIQVVDVGLNFASDPQKNELQTSFVIRYNKTLGPDYLGDDFPVLKLFVPLPGASQITPVSFITNHETGSQNHLEDFSMIDLSTEGILINFLGRENNFFHVIFDAGSLDAAEFSRAIGLGTRTVFFASTGQIVYDSATLLATPARFSFDSETRKFEIVARMGEAAPWTNSSQLLYSVAMMNVNDPNFVSSTQCQTGVMPSLESVVSESGDGSQPLLFPPEWSKSAATQPSIGLTLSVHTVLDTFFTSSATVMRCSGTLPEGVAAPTTLSIAFMHTSPFTDSLDGLQYSLRTVSIEPVVWSIPSDAVVRVPLGDDSEAPAAAAAALESHVPQWLNESLKMKGVADGSASSAIVIRVPAELAIFLPSVEMLEAALPVLANSHISLPSGASGVSLDEFYVPQRAGAWRCGSEGVFDTCKIAETNCASNYTAPLACYQNGPSISPGEFDATVACAFDDMSSLPDLPVSSGCGTWLCSVGGSFIPCDDARVCIHGCVKDLPITEDLISENAAFAVKCVVGDQAVDQASCPSSMVAAPKFAETCNATSTCGTVCTDSEGVRVACNDPKSWSSCSDPCRGGMKDRNVRCADITVAEGEASSDDVPVSFCPSGGFDVETSTGCSGSPAFCPAPRVNVTTFSDEEGVYYVSWDDSAGTLDLSEGAAVIDLVAVDVSGVVPGTIISLGNTSAALMFFRFDIIDHNIVPGKYYASVVLEGENPNGTSSPFTVVFMCSAANCHHGTCNQAAGTCDCIGEWSGTECNVQPCATKGCNPEGSRCDDTNSDTAQCICFTDTPDGSPLFLGDTCDIPTNYCQVEAAPCKNGGTRTGSFAVDGSYVCDSCVCTHSWVSSTDCSTCGLACAHDTVANSDCASCNCPAFGGLTGNLCECRGAYMTFVVLDGDVDFSRVEAEFSRVHGDSSGANAVEKLSAMFASELSAVTRIPRIEQAVSVSQTASPAGVRYYTIVLTVGPVCDGIVPVGDDRMTPTYAAITSLKTLLSNNAHLNGGRVALSAMHMRSGFGANDPRCRLDGDQCPTGWRANGVFTDAEGALDCEGADASDPACKGGEIKKGGDGLSTGAIVGIAVGGSIALLLIILLVCWLAGICCFAAANGSKNRGVEMTSV